MNLKVTRFLSKGIEYIAQHSKGEVEALDAVEGALKIKPEFKGIKWGEKVNVGDFFEKVGASNCIASEVKVAESNVAIKHKAHLSPVEQAPKSSIKPPIRTIDPVLEPNFELGPEFSDIEVDLRKQLAELKVPVQVDGSEIRIIGSNLRDVPATKTYMWTGLFGSGHGGGGTWILDRNMPTPPKAYIKPHSEGPRFRFSRQRSIYDKTFREQYEVFLTDPITKRYVTGEPIKIDNIQEEVLADIFKKISSEPEIAIGELGQYSEALDKAISFYIETKSNLDIIKNRNIPIIERMLKKSAADNGKSVLASDEIQKRVYRLLKMTNINNNNCSYLSKLNTDFTVYGTYFYNLGHLTGSPSEVILGDLLNIFRDRALQKMENPSVKNFTIREIENTIEKLKQTLDIHSEYLETFDNIAEDAANVINSFVDKNTNIFKSHGLDFDSLYVTPPKMYDEYLEAYRNLKLGKENAKFEATLQDLLIDAHYGKDNVKDFEVEKNKFRLSIKKFWKFRKGLYNVESGREVHGICNELTAIYASHLQELFPEKVFMPVCDTSTFGIKHWFIACFDRTDSNLEKFGKDFRINLTAIRDAHGEKGIDDLFKDAVIIDPSPGIYGKYGSEEVAHYKIDAISSLDQITDRVQEENPLNIHCDQAIILGWVKRHVSPELFEELLNKFPETTQILFSIKGKKIVINGKECTAPANEINVHRLIPGVYGAPVDLELKRAILNDPTSSLYKFIKNYEARGDN